MLTSISIFFAHAVDFGPFEQTEGSRYHNIVYPMLQVAVAILANLGRNHRTGTSKVCAIALVASNLTGDRSTVKSLTYPLLFVLI